MRRLGFRGLVVVAALVGAAVLVAGVPARAGPLVPAGGVLRVSVPEAFGGKTVIGQLTVDQAVGPGYVTAFGCADGFQRDSAGDPARSDLNFDGRVSPVASNRLIVQADELGDVCFYTRNPAALIIDVSAVSVDTGITSFANRRTDTRRFASPIVPAGGVLRVAVPEAAGGKAVVGQVTADVATGPGYVTAYACDEGLARGPDGDPPRSDLNFDGRVWPVASNRLIVQADASGDVCLYTSSPVALIVDVNGVADNGVDSFVNRRVDTRGGEQPIVPGGSVLRVAVPEAAGGKSVIGQLTVDRAQAPGYVAAFACDTGLPVDGSGDADRSDLNYNGAVGPVASNRLIVAADADGDVCFYTLRAVALIVDINGVATDAAISSFPTRRVDTRQQGATPTIPIDDSGVPTWPAYTPLPALVGVAALTGLPTDQAIAARPILAVKIDNYWRARPQFGLDRADVVFEENVEGVTRFVALFHSDVPAEVGPVRSARTGDLDLVAGMNRPVFAYSGANPGVTAWIDAAAASGVLTDLAAQRAPCYGRTGTRPSPHNLLLDPACALDTALGFATPPGSARPLWAISPGWSVPADATPLATFAVAMDGVAVEWEWSPPAGAYMRYQDGAPHVTSDGVHLRAANVVVLAVEHVPSPVDARSPHPITVGSGPAVIHRDGVAVPAVWSRASPFEPFQFLDAGSGAPIPLAPGTTFVELTRG